MGLPALIWSEERLRSEDMGHYFRVAADNRDLNYDKFVVKGEVHTMADESYTSHNTNRLDVDVDNVLHHGLGDAHGVDGIGGLVGGQADNALNTSVNGSMQDIISADDVSLNSLHREELAGRNLLQSGSVEDVVNAGHGVTDRLGVADITDIELDLLCSFRMLSLEFVTHIVLLFLIDYEKQRLCVTPGLSCYWQIAPHRNDLSFEEWMDLDVKYVKERSFWVDWKIIFKTFKVCLLGRGE